MCAHDPADVRVPGVRPLTEREHWDRLLELANEQERAREWWAQERQRRRLRRKEERRTEPRKPRVVAHDPAVLEAAKLLVDLVDPRSWRDENDRGGKWRYEHDRVSLGRRVTLPSLSEYDET